MLERQFKGWTKHADGGVADHDVHTVKLLPERRERLGETGGVADISLHRERPPAQFVVIFVASVLVLSVRTLFAAQGDLASWLFAFPVHVALRALYTALLGPLIYVVARAAGAPNFLGHGPSSAES